MKLLASPICRRCWLVAFGVVFSTFLDADAQVIVPIVGKAERSDTSKPLRELAKEAAARCNNNYGLGEKLDNPARSIVDYLDAKQPGAVRGELTRLDDAILAKEFPKVSFFVLRFRQGPVAFEVPEGLNASNIGVVTKDDTTLVGSADSLAALFKKQLAPAKDETAKKQAMVAWLRLIQELHQDGFYKFAASHGDAVKVVGGRETSVSGQVKVIPQGGNSGLIEGELVFDAAGAVVRGKGTARLQEGIRPICQATKLLDADLLVRRMAERDILVMGSMARDYLSEQHAKALAPLQGEIERVWDRIQTEQR